MKNNSALFIAAIVITVLLAISIALGSRYDEDEKNLEHAQQSEVSETENDNH